MTFDMERKEGVVVTWNAPKGYGIVQVGGPASLERYFLHTSKIRSGTAMPSRGMRVSFDVSDKPTQEGRLPQAVRADIDMTTSVPGKASQGGAL